MKSVFRSMSAVILLFSFAAMARAEGVANPHSHLGSAAQIQRARIWNRTYSGMLRPMAGAPWNVQRPFSEIEPTGFVAISGENELELASLREAIAKNLPAGVTLVVYVSDSSAVAALQKDLGQYLPAAQLKFMTIQVPIDGDSLWARDSLPFPVYLTAPAPAPAPAAAFGLVDSIYPQDFNPGPDIEKALSLPMTDTNLVFRGGNLLFDLNANCFAEDVNEVGDLSDPTAFFTQFFGCKTVTLLAQQGGIGDIDERIKFLPGKVALTDNDSYAAQLQAKGYDVHRIPVINGAQYETYMNTLIVNGTIFVPQMGLASDAAALAAYQALGFKAVGVLTKQLADQDLGNIHCLTMNYPPGAFAASLEGPNFVKFAGR